MGFQYHFDDCGDPICSGAAAFTLKPETSPKDLVLVSCCACEGEGFGKEGWGGLGTNTLPFNVRSSEKPSPKAIKGNVAKIELCCTVIQFTTATVPTPWLYILQNHYHLTKLNMLTTGTALVHYYKTITFEDMSKRGGTQI